MEEEQEDEMITTQQHMPLPVQALVMFCFLWQSLFNISNAAIAALLQFLKNFFILLASFTKQDGLRDIAVSLPASVKAAVKLIGLDKDTFTTYVVCPTCNSVYTMEDCYEKDIRDTITSKKCVHVEFPNHPQAGRRKPCGVTLLKPVRLCGGGLSYCPRKVFCYNQLQQCLAALANRPGFLNKCTHWKHRVTRKGMMSDIYDGKIWKHFQDYLEVSHSFGLALGCDWFQPFKHIADSVGALYLIVLNLPREERFKPENIILAGIIPGPKEPQSTINSYLAPLVNELITLWDGVQIPCTLPDHPSSVIIRACLMVVCCDLPAVRKLCGFAGHSAIHGCSKCNRTFPSGVFEHKLDYSGYNRENWQARTLAEHNRQSHDYREAKTKTERQLAFSQSGVRFSVLSLLPYFDIIRMHTIDPMHNLLLGTSKHVMELWCKLDIIGSHNLSAIQQTVEKIITPHSVGRVSMKIGSTFSGLSADQWKNWIVLFSAIALKGNIPVNHYQCWLLYIRACTLLCSRTLTAEQIESADSYLHLFCRQFQAIFGPQYCTPNLHLHLHLKECLQDYGPVYGFWCFPFERYDGILGSFHTNQKAV